MVNLPNDGGPAFPGTRHEQVGMLSDHGIVEEDSRQDAPTFDDVSHPGMSLRDWFAGQALVGEIASMDATQQLSVHEGESTSEALSRDAMRRAEWCYRQADAMLVARKASR